MRFWGVACVVAWVVVWSGCGQHDEPRSPSDLERACASDRVEGRFRACFGLGSAYTTGRGVPRDPVRAASLYERACRGGLVVGCVNLGVLFALGDGVPQDEATAASYFRAACERGPPGEESAPVACVNLGVLVDNGLVASPNESAVGLFDRACRAGFATGCRYAGLALLPRDAARGQAFLEKACTAGDTIGCGSVERARRGDPVEFEETILFAKVNYHY